MAHIEVTLVRSTIGRPEKHRRVVRSLGLRKIRQTVRHDDNPRIRGMIKKVSHLVRAEIVEDK